MPHYSFGGPCTTLLILTSPPRCLVLWVCLNILWQRLWFHRSTKFVKIYFSLGMPHFSFDCSWTLLIFVYSDFSRFIFLSLPWKRLAVFLRAGAEGRCPSRRGFEGRARRDVRNRVCGGMKNRLWFVCYFLQAGLCKSVSRRVWTQQWCTTRGGGWGWLGVG